MELNSSHIEDSTHLDKIDDSLNNFKTDIVLGVRFSNAGTNFSVCTTCGFAIYDSDPVQLRFMQDFGKGIAIAELFRNTNIVALVGGGETPMYPKNHVIFWDDSQDEIVHDISFESDVLNLIFSDDRFHVVLKNAVYEYKFPFNKPTNKPIVYLTADNPRGVCAFYSVRGREIFATVDEKTTTSICVRFPNNITKEKKFTCEEYYKTQQHLAFLRISHDGKKLASVMEDGYDISIWDLENLILNHMKPEIVFRRSSTPALVLNITFDLKTNIFCTSCESKTIHFFSLELPNYYYLAMQNKSSYLIEKDDQTITESVRICSHVGNRVVVVAFQSERCAYYIYQFSNESYVPLSSQLIFQDGIYNSDL